MVQELEKYGNTSLQCDIMEDEIKKAEGQLAKVQQENQVLFDTILAFYNRQLLLNRIKAESQEIEFNSFKVTLIFSENQFNDIDISAPTMINDHLFQHEMMFI
jgi:hypothetical protein